MLAEYARRRDFVIERLRAIPGVTRSAVPGEAFGTHQHVRISYATSMHELERGLERLHRFIVEQ
jgi:aspartate/methionine/tyrosine aminotransferase